MIASCSDLTSDKLLLLITMILHLLLEIPFVQQLVSCVLRIRWQGAITTLPLRNQDVHFSFESSVTWTQPNDIGMMERMSGQYMCLQLILVGVFRASSIEVLNNILF
jgi:hypothetical protein